MFYYGVSLCFPFWFVILSDDSITATVMLLLSSPFCFVIVFDVYMYYCDISLYSTFCPVIVSNADMCVILCFIKFSSLYRHNI